MPWTCFMLTPTERERRWLRRYTFSHPSACPHHLYGHDAEVRIEDGRVAERPQDAAVNDDPGNHDDPRWPRRCSCGYQFMPKDEWQLFRRTIYLRADNGAETTLAEAPVGAMYDAPWLHGMHHYRVVDGQTLVVKLPGGAEWVIDGESSSGGFWERTGTPPRITARPSILTPNYHGWLTDGVLSDDLEGRQYG